MYAFNKEYFTCGEKKTTPCEAGSHRITLIKSPQEKTFPLDDMITMVPSRLISRDHFSFVFYVFSFSRWCSQLMMLATNITPLPFSSVPFLTQPQQ